MPRFIRTLRGCGVPVVASPDLDILNDGKNVEKIVHALGGQWSKFVDDYRISVQQFEGPKVARTNGEVLSLLSAVLEKDPEASYVLASRQSVNDILRIESPWKNLKKFGLLAFRAERKRVDNLMADFGQIGLVPVKVGELECFAPQTDVSKGAEWLAAAIRDGAHEGVDSLGHAADIEKSLLRQEGPGCPDESVPG